MGPFYWVVQVDFGEGIEFYFGYITSWLPDRHPRRFQVGIWIYKFKPQRRSQGWRFKYGIHQMAIIPWDKINCLDRVKEDDQGLSFGAESAEEREVVSELGGKLDKWNVLI